jgi:2Fe-2S ferredoxin
MAGMTAVSFSANRTRLSPAQDCDPMKILVTDQSGIEHELEGLDGWRTMEVIRDWGLNIKAECGGACSCATCHVYVDEAWVDKLPPPSDDEEDLLFSTLDKKPNSRLSCQILLSDELDGMKVTLAKSAAKD